MCFPLKFLAHFRIGFMNIDWVSGKGLVFGVDGANTLVIQDLFEGRKEMETGNYTTQLKS